MLIELTNGDIYTIKKTECDEGINYILYDEPTLFKKSILLSKENMIELNNRYEKIKEIVTKNVL